MISFGGRGFLTFRVFPDLRTQANCAEAVLVGLPVQVFLRSRNTVSERPMNQILLGCQGRVSGKSPNPNRDVANQSLGAKRALFARFCLEGLPCLCKARQKKNAKHPAHDFLNSLADCLRDRLPHQSSPGILSGYSAQIPPPQYPPKKHAQTERMTVNPQPPIQSSNLREGWN